MPIRINEIVLDTERKPGGHEFPGSIYPDQDHLRHRTQKNDNLKDFSFLDDFQDRLTGEVPAEILQTTDNLNYTTSLNFIDIVLFRGMLRQNIGSDNDFTITGPNKVTFTTPVPNGTSVLADLFIRERYTEVNDDLFTTEDNLTFKSSRPMLTKPHIIRGGIQYEGVDYSVVDENTILFTTALPGVQVNGSYITKSRIIGEQLTRIDSRNYETKFLFQKIRVYRALPQFPGASNDYVEVNDYRVTFNVDVPEAQPVIADYVLKF